MPGRLKRAHGHLNKVIAMLEEGRDCVTVAQQLQAVESAVIKAKKALIRDHVEHCLDDAMKSGAAPCASSRQSPSTSDPTPP